MAGRKSPNVSGHPHEDRALMKEIFGDMPVVEARRDLYIELAREDIDKAVEEVGEEKVRPHCCIVAQACKRLLKSRGVLIFSKTAYVDILHGTRRKLTRFIIPETTQKIIKRFDQGKVVDEVGIYLRKPSPSERVVELAKRKRRIRRLVAQGKHTPVPRDHRQRAKPRHFALASRSGQGKATYGARI